MRTTIPIKHRHFELNIRAAFPRPRKADALTSVEAFPDAGLLPEYLFLAV